MEIAADERSLTEEINTATPGGKLIFHIFGALAEFERGLIIERTRESNEGGTGARHQERPATQVNPPTKGRPRPPASGRPPQSLAVHPLPRATLDLPRFYGLNSSALDLRKPRYQEGNKERSNDGNPKVVNPTHRNFVSFHL
jgi:hypothetical protein